MQKRDEVRVYLCYRFLVERSLLLVGLWPIGKSYWYRLLPYASLIHCTISIFAIANFLIHHGNSINMIIKIISFFIGIVLLGMRLLIMINNRKRLAFLHGHLNDFCDEIIKDNRLIEPAFMRVHACFILSWLVIIGIWGSFFVMLVVLPSINMIIQSIKDPAHINYVTVYPTRYPWASTSAGIIHRITFLFESISAFNACLIATGVDNLILFYVFQATSQLRAMSYRLTNIREGENYDDIIKTCVMHYVTVIKCCKTVERIYGPIIFSIIGSSAVMMCSLMYQLSQATFLTKIQMMRVAFYVFCKLSQIYLYTWSGTLLREESERYLEAVYLSDWIETRSVRIVLITICQRPLTIKACHILMSSVETFAKTINTTISYFLLLRTIASKDQ